VANHINFTHLGHALEIVVPKKVFWNELINRLFVHVERRQAIANAS